MGDGPPFGQTRTKSVQGGDEHTSWRPEESPRAEEDFAGPGTRSRGLAGRPAAPGALAGDACHESS